MLSDAGAKIFNCIDEGVDPTKFTTDSHECRDAMIRAFADHVAQARPILVRSIAPECPGLPARGNRCADRKGAAGPAKFHSPVVEGEGMSLPVTAAPRVSMLICVMAMP